MSFLSYLRLDALPEFAARFSQSLRQGDVILLSGPLGVGKTAMARALIHAVQTHPQPVPSPSMPLIIPHVTQRGIYWHADLYRLDIGDPFSDELPDYLGQGYALLLEWPDRLGSRQLFNQGWQMILDETGDEDVRQVKIEPLKFEIQVT